MLIVLSGCGAGWQPVSDVGQVDVPDAAMASPDGRALMPWGTWAATLAVRPCALDSVLTVNTTDDELEGGTGLNALAAAGARLSLVEALWLAANHPGPDTITFDPTIFPVDSPSTIVIDGSHDVPRTLAPVCIDARDRGVIVTWGPARTSDNSARFVWPIENGSLQIGLEMVDPMALRVTSGGQVAGCHFTIQPSTTQSLSFVNLEGGTAGPGNVAEGRAVAVTGTGTVIKSFFGLNPLTGKSNPSHLAITTGGNLIVEESIILASATGVMSVGRLTLKNNSIGIARDAPVFGRHAEISQTGVVLLGGPARIEGNVIRALDEAVEVYPNVIATFTHNQVLAPAGIRLNGTSQLQAPTITGISSGEVRGTCSTPGHIELFSGTTPDFLADVFVGEGACDASGQWVISITPRGDFSLVATLTQASGNTTPFSAPVAVP